MDPQRSDEAKAVGKVCDERLQLVFRRVLGIQDGHLLIRLFNIPGKSYPAGRLVPILRDTPR